MTRHGGALRRRMALGFVAPCVSARNRLASRGRRVALGIPEFAQVATNINAHVSLAFANVHIAYNTLTSNTRWNIATMMREGGPSHQSFAVSLNN